MVLKNEHKIIWSVNLLVVLGSLSVNIYLPSLPTLEKVFHTSPNLLKLSITLFLLGYGLSQFFWGSLSERVGRKKPIFWGLSLACAGSILAMSAYNVTMLNIARFIEGFGIGCAVVMGRAILTDSFGHARISRMASFMLIAANIMPALAPLLGGFILLFFSWRIIFLFLILYTLGIIFLYFKIVPETHRKIKKTFSFTDAIQEYLHTLTHRTFLGYFLLNVLLSGGLLAYYAATPFIFITALHLSPHIYSFLSLATVGTYILGSFLSTSITRSIGFNRTILFGIFFGVLAGILLVLCWFFSSLSILTVILPMMFFSLSVGIIAPNTNAGAMSALGHMAGSAAAVLGAGTSAIGAILVYILSILNLQNIGSLALFFTILSLVVLVVYFSVLPKKPIEGNIL